MRVEAFAALALLTLAACGGGGGGGAAAPPPAAPPGAFLGVADVERAIAQAAAEASASGLRAHIVVVDRVGNPLAAYSMEGAPATVTISSGLGVMGGLDGTANIPAPYAALAKAITGAYLSSNGNAFSTRTAGQIIQEHFNPQEPGQPSGPLYGVQFSQLPCSDVVVPERFRAGPRPSPLGLSADPGGLPLYKDGVLAGGIGVEADGRYGLDRNIVDIDDDAEERIALAATTSLPTPTDIRGDRITADGRTFRFVDSAALRSNPAGAPPLAQVAGAMVALPGYAAPGPRAGTVFGAAASGVTTRAGHLGVGEAQTLGEHFLGGGSFDGLLTQAEVRELLAQALRVALRARAQIRRPPGSHAQVNIAVVERNGGIVGFVRTVDAPVFGIDVAVQKARTALWFSIESAFDSIAGRAAGSYLADARAFLGAPDEFKGATAWSTRAIGNLHRPFYPDGIRGAPRGPLSTPIGRWSPFDTGMQLDLALDDIVRALPAPHGSGCIPGVAMRNGMQVFPGGIPLYRGRQVIGAIGISGDGVDQDDMVAYLAVANAARALGSLGHAPADMRADRHAPHGARLRYVQCPQAPFVDSNEQEACAP